MKKLIHFLRYFSVDEKLNRALFAFIITLSLLLGGCAKSPDVKDTSMLISPEAAEKSQTEEPTITMSVEPTSKPTVEPSEVPTLEAKENPEGIIYPDDDFSIDPEEDSTQTTSNGENSNTDPIILDIPPFEYYLSDKVNINENHPIKLDLISSKRNEIIDDDQWFINNELTNNTYQIIHVFQGTAGSLPDFIPDSYDGLIITSAFYDDSNIYCIYGSDYSEGYLLIIFDAKFQTKLYTIDFSNYRYAPEYISEDYDYVQQAIKWAEIKDNILYISHSHFTYAKSSKNMNAYITAIDLSDMSILWRTDALVSNAYNFEIINDVIICGYGFTDEPDFLYQIDIYSGTILDKLKLKTGPSYFIRKDDILYVRTYNTDYEFKITK